MSVTLQLPAVLAKLADGRRTLEVRGATLGDVVADVAERFPGLAPRLRDGEGKHGHCLRAQPVGQRD